MLTNYPRNVIFAQRLKDEEKTAQTYFGVENNDTVGIKFANAVYARFYTSEIGVEELGIFDLKCKAIFDANIEMYKSLYNARVNFSEAAESGIFETDETEYGHIITDETDPAKKDVEKVDVGGVVYADVSETGETRTKEYKVTHSNSGTDTRTVNKSGDASNFTAISEAAGIDIFRAFTDKFINLFMGVL